MITKTALRSTRVRAVLAGVAVLVVVLVGTLVARGNEPDATATAGTTTAPVASSSAAPAPSSAPPATATSTGTSPAAPGADPAAGGTNVDELPPSLAPVALTDPASTGDGVTGRVTELTAIQSSASGPGNIAGAALRVTVELTNGTAAPVPLDEVTVTLTYGADGTPGSPSDDSSLQPFAGSLAPGASATGVYVFSVPVGSRDLVNVQVGRAAGVPYLVFTGSA